MLLTMLTPTVTNLMRWTMTLAVVMISLFATTTEAQAQTKYKIKTDGNCEVYYTDLSNFNDVIVTEAEAGKELSIRVKENANPAAGKYFTGEFTLNGTSLGSNQWEYNAEFTMPS